MDPLSTKLMFTMYIYKRITKYHVYKLLPTTGPLSAWIAILAQFIQSITVIGLKSATYHKFPYWSLFSLENVYSIYHCTCFYFLKYFVFIYGTLIC